MKQSNFRHTIIDFVLVLVMVSMTACAAIPTEPLTSAHYVPLAIPDGAIYVLQPGSTLHGIMQVINKAPGTGIFTDPGSKVVLFTWPVKDVGRAWVQMPNVKNGLQAFMTMTGGKGSIVNNATWKTLSSYMMDYGWKTILPGAVSAELLEQIGVATASITIGTAATSLPSIIVMPAISIEEILDMLFGESIKV